MYYFSPYSASLSKIDNITDTCTRNFFILSWSNDDLSFHFSLWLFLYDNLIAFHWCLFWDSSSVGWCTLKESWKRDGSMYAGNHANEHVTWYCPFINTLYNSLNRCTLIHEFIDIFYAGLESLISAYLNQMYK